MNRMQRVVLVAVMTMSAILVFPQQFSKQDECSYFFQESIRLKASQQYAEAYDLLRHCLMVDSTDAGVLFELSAYHKSLNDKVTALSYLIKAHEYDPQNVWITFQLATTWEEAGNLEESIRLMKEIIAERPAEVDLYFPLSQMYVKLKDYDAALNALDKLENSVGVKQEIILSKCQIYDIMGKPSKAIHEMERLARSQQDNVGVQLALVTVYLSQLKNDVKGKIKAKARSVLDGLIAVNPSNGDCLMAMADFFVKTGDDDGVNKMLTTVIDSPKVDLDSKLGALQYFVRQSPQDSVYLQTAFQKVLDQYPDEYPIHQMYVAWLMQHNEKELSKTELRNVLDMNPDQKDVWEDYLSLYLAENNVDRVEEITHEALSYFPNHYVFWYYLAIARSIKKNYPEAIEAYLKATEYASDGQKEFISDCYGNIGDLYHEMEDTVSSYAFYEKALNCNPNNILVLNNYAYFLCTEGKSMDKAEEMSRQVIKAEPANSTYLDTYAWICFKQGKYDTAKNYMERAFLNLEIANAEIAEHYGDILWFCGEKEAAAAQWLQAFHLSDAPSDILKTKVDTGQYCE